MPVIVEYDLFDDAIDYGMIMSEIEKFTTNATSELADHPIEGVCIRVGNKVWKHKTFEFKIMDGHTTVASVEDVS